MEFGMLLIFVGMMNLILLLSRPFNIQGREPYIYDFVKGKSLTLAFIQTIDGFLSNLA